MSSDLWSQEDKKGTRIARNSPNTNNRVYIQEPLLGKGTITSHSLIHQVPIMNMKWVASFEDNQVKHSKKKLG